MKYFICALDEINIGIPAERTERIIPAERTLYSVCETVIKTETGAEAGTQSETKTAYISLPLLFKQKNTGAPHGIILKPSGGQAPQKTVLLTPRIEKEIDIPEENIHSLPESFAGLRGFFGGACFDKENVILVLDTKKLTEKYCD